MFTFRVGQGLGFGLIWILNYVHVQTGVKIRAGTFSLGSCSG